MSCAVIIRDYRLNDYPSVSEVVRNAYLSNVNRSWFNALTREITFQLIVISAAVLFILVGVPLSYCVIAIPLVLLIIYVSIYSSFLLKATELMHSKKPLHCWVAEACESFILLQHPERINYRILSEIEANSEGFDKGNYRRKIIGTVSVSQHMHLDNSAWLFRLAVHSSYQRKGIGHALILTAKKWCREKTFDGIELAMSECQDVARQLFVDTGFEMRQMYHKQLMGSALTLLMFQLGCDLGNTKPIF